jgi:raffinose/stachyose/melibiose transport system permease protein
MSLGPSVATFVLSFTDITGVSGVQWHFIGFENYKEFLFRQNHRDLVDVLRNTLVFCVAVTIIQNALALPIALALNSKLIKGKTFFRAVVFLPVVLGVLVTSLVWMAVLHPMEGPVSQLIGILGLSSTFFTGQDPAALICVIFTQIWMYLGYSMVINLAGLQAIPTELYEAGEIDGTSKWQGFRYITFPMLWSTINANLLLAVIGSLQSFQIILIATGGRNMATQTLAARSIFYAFAINARDNNQAMRQGYGAAWAMILFVFIFVATLLYQRVTKRREEE